MKNTILNYDTEELYLTEPEQDGYNIRNYFSKDVHISDLANKVEKWDKYIDTYRMADNDRLERISYELYGTTDYWDIIFLLNERDPLFEMPFDFDTLSDDSTSFLDTYRFYIYSNSPLYSSSRSDELKEEFLSKSMVENEAFRYITVVKPSKMSQFLTILKDEGYL